MTYENKKCRAYPDNICNQECFLIDHFVSQATKGGGDTKEMRPIPPGDVGPYWDRENWENLVKNTLEYAKKGCACKKELKAIIETVTESKQSKGEIVEKNPGRNLP